jgi:predicted amidohydrolase
MASNAGALALALAAALADAATEALGAVLAVEPPHAAKTIAAVTAKTATDDHLDDRVILAHSSSEPPCPDAASLSGLVGRGTPTLASYEALGSRRLALAVSPVIPPGRGAYAPAMQASLTIALAQIAPQLGDLDANLERHHALLDEARTAAADLVVFPELGLTGYQLQDLASEVAMRLDDPRLAKLAAATAGLSAIVSFVEESADHRLFIAAALLEDGEIRHVHRKVFLPTYGLFDERRFFAAGDVLRAVPSRLGVGIGIGVCEDFWHLGVPETLALDGAQILINVSSSPGRDLAATNEVGLGTATSWRTLMRAYAQLTTSFVVFCNRVGVDESISFWGGSEVIGPNGAAVFSAPLYDEGLFTVAIAPGDIRRERIALPLLRDERPELHVRELSRIVAERAGMMFDRTADPEAEAGLDVAPGVPRPHPIGFGSDGERTARPTGTDR